MAKLKSLFLFTLLVNLAVGYVLQELNPDLDPIVEREKRHLPKKTISFHHTINTGHKEVHKTGELHVGPGGVSHSKHTFITKHGHEHEPHGQDTHEYSQHSHYEDGHTGHGKPPKPFIDLIGVHIGDTIGGLRENTHSKSYSVQKEIGVNHESHNFRDSEDFPEDSAPNSDHMDIRGIFGTKP